MTRSRWLFGFAVFLGAFLFFLVEPIAAKQLLPVLGGSAAVWITCLVFFQTALLCAYLYAHWMSNRPRWVLYFALLIIGFASALGWCLRGAGSGLGSVHPILTVFAVLASTIGLPFLVLGTTSPLMQVWWARLHGSAIPYRLFALSNLASLLALGLYPTMIEPRLTLQAQRIAWCCGFAVFALITGLLAWKVRTTAMVSLSENAGGEEGAPAPQMHRLLWVLLPMGAAMQLSAVTSYLTANVAAIPLLWILPLGVYLLTIIIAFEFPRLLPRSIVARFLILMLAGLGYALSKQDVEWPLRISIGFFLIEAFASCLFCHSEAYRLRPKRAAESTLFYLAVCSGWRTRIICDRHRVSAGISIQHRSRHYVLLHGAAGSLVTWRDGWNSRLLWGVATIVMAVQIFWINIVNQRRHHSGRAQFLWQPARKANLRLSWRDSAHTDERQRRAWDADFRHRRTAPHADELLRRGLRCGARYTVSAVGGGARNIGVIGLGAGTIAAYGRPGRSDPVLRDQPRRGANRHAMSSPISAIRAPKSHRRRAMHGPRWPMSLRRGSMYW